MINALRLVLQFIDLVVNLIKPDAIPPDVAAESVELQSRHAAVCAGGDLQDAVVHGRGSVGSFRSRLGVEAVFSVASASIGLSKRVL